MSILTKGRTELNCYNNIGGIKAVYFTEFIEYNYSDIVGEKGVLLTSIPSAFVYKYDVTGGSFNQTIEQSENGELYSQELNFTLLKQDRLTTKELQILSNIDLRYIVSFNDGSLKVGGLYNGAKVTALDAPTGGTKASLNGYTITISGSESYQAAYVNNLSDAGFIEFEKPTTLSNFIYQSGDNYIFQDSNNYILNDV